jgi:hypothetical protein
MCIYEDRFPSVLMDVPVQRKCTNGIVVDAEAYLMLT